MKVAVKRLARDEKGQTLIIALILLTISGLIAAPLLSYMGTGLTAGGVYERKADELYAADAGVEDAIWKIQHQISEVQELSCGGGNHSWSYPEGDDPPFDVNGKFVDVTITSVNVVDNITFSYHIESTATGSGSGTQIDAYINGNNKYGDFAGLLSQILTSQGEIDVAEKVILDPPDGPNGPCANYTDAWPTAEELAQFYQEADIEYEEYYFDTIDIDGIDREIGPLYRDGELDIRNSNSTAATLTLTGTVYITDQTEIGTGGSGQNTLLLDLNGQTIFVSDSTTGSQKALILGGKCTVKGPGVIIAVGDIEFKPESQVGAEEGGGPVFILSVSGTTTLRPSSTIYGSIAGSVEVYVQQGEEPTITYPEGGFGESNLSFPIGVKYLVYSIASWDVGPPE